MPNIRPTELIIILVIIVLLFGAKKLPELAKSVGQSLKIFKHETQDVTNEASEKSSAASAVPTPPAVSPTAEKVPTSDDKNDTITDNI